MNNAYAPHLTAIVRSKPSSPARTLHDLDLLKGHCLDYGCGHGMDALTYGMDRYDPHWYPIRPSKQYDTVTCTYVLNVVRTEDVPYILKDIQTLLAPGGTAYLTVRRDLYGPTSKGRGTTQRNVHLPLPVLKNTKGYCIYILKNVDSVV